MHQFKTTLASDKITSKQVNELDKEKQKRCINCYHVADEKDKYCIKCGSPLTNHCGDIGGKLHKGCSFVNKEDAAFCAKCGYPTIFNQHGLITPTLSGQHSQSSFGRININ